MIGSRQLSVVALAVAVAALGLFSAAHAQAPVTPADFKAILDEAADASREMADVEQEEAELKEQALDWQQRREEHNANPCTYPPGSPEVCSAYDAEAEQLNAERDELLAKVQQNDQRRRMLKNHWGILMARLRIAPFLGRLESWKDEVVRCSKLAPEPSVGCLRDVWERVP